MANMESLYLAAKDTSDGSIVGYAGCGSGNVLSLLVEGLTWWSDAV